MGRRYLCGCKYISIVQGLAACLPFSDVSRALEQRTSGGSARESPQSGMCRGLWDSEPAADPLTVGVYRGFGVAVLGHHAGLAKRRPWKTCWFCDTEGARWHG